MDLESLQDILPNTEVIFVQDFWYSKIVPSFGKSDTRIPKNYRLKYQGRGSHSYYFLNVSRKYTHSVSHIVCESIETLESFRNSKINKIINEYR